MEFKAWNPYLVGVVLIFFAVGAFLWERPSGGIYGWADPGTKKVVGIVLAAGGAWSIISGIRKRR